MSEVWSQRGEDYHTSDTLDYKYATSIRCRGKVPIMIWEAYSTSTPKGERDGKTVRRFHRNMDEIYWCIASCDLLLPILASSLCRNFRAHVVLNITPDR